MAKPKTSIIKIKNNDILNDDNLYNAQNLVKNHFISDINNNDNNNNNSNSNSTIKNNVININTNHINTVTDKQDLNYANKNTHNNLINTNFDTNNFIQMQTVNQQKDLNKNNLLSDTNHLNHNQFEINFNGNFNDCFVYDDLSLLPLIDDKAILANLKTKFENQKYYVSD